MAQRTPTDIGYVVVWHSWGKEGNEAGLYGQSHDSSGMPLDTEFLINAYTQGSQAETSVSLLSSGGFVVAYQGENAISDDPSGTGISAQLFDASGNKKGTELLVNSQTRVIVRADELLIFQLQSVCTHISRQTLG